MNIINSFKNNSKFRTRVIIVALIVFLVYGTGVKKEADRQAFETCDQYNTYGWSNFIKDMVLPFNWFNNLKQWKWEDKTSSMGVSGDNKALCVNQGCVVSRIPVANWYDSTVCVPYALTGWVVTNADDCKDGCVNEIDDQLYCKACDASEACTTKEKPIAKIVQGMFPSLSCKTAYYTVIFGGGFFAIVFLLMAL